MEDTDSYISAAKREIIQNLFIDTADDNYIVARWSYINNLHLDFFWLSVHALEKYMKAALLLNGKSAKCYNHDIPKLYEQIKLLAFDLLPDELLPPDQVDKQRWSKENSSEFISRLYQNGNAENRYKICGYLQKSEDLHKMDMMLYALRRVCVNLDAIVLQDSKVTERENLTNRPEMWKICSQYKLEKVIDGGKEEYLKNILLTWNYSFAPKCFQHPPSRTSFAAHNSALKFFILNPLEQSSDEKKIATAKHLNEWVFSNIQLSNDIKQQLKEATKRHPQ